MIRTLLSLGLMLCATSLASATERYEAVLLGQAILPAQSFMDPPADAPEFFRSSGKFTTPDRVRSRVPPTRGLSPPFSGQVLQGISSMHALGDGSYLALSDNGFGSKQNSPDAMLFVSRLRPDFTAGTVEVFDTVFLSDPDHQVPFVITMEGTEARYLTGADFDVEAFALVGETLIIGDEFGPYLLTVNAQSGHVISVQETQLVGTALRSPDHPRMRAGNPGRPGLVADIARSRGFEGLAHVPGTDLLYPMLEGPIWRDGEIERTDDGAPALRILEFDSAGAEWTGRSWLYPLEARGHAVGALTLIDATRGLVIERDGGQGDAERVCAEGQTEGCFKRPAAFKRVYLIDFAGLASGEKVRKLGYVDLLDISDPDGRAVQGTRTDGRFRFPFVTIESLVQVDESTVLISNDNNFPFSKGRDPDRPDDTEFILLDVRDLLSAATYQ